MSNVYKLIDKVQIATRRMLNDVEMRDIIDRYPNDRGLIALDVFKLGYVRGQQAARHEQKKAMQTGDAERDSYRQCLERHIAAHSTDADYLKYLYMQARSFEEVCK